MLGSTGVKVNAVNTVEGHVLIDFDREVRHSIEEILDHGDVMAELPYRGRNFSVQFESPVTMDENGFDRLATVEEVEDVSVQIRPATRKISII